MYEFLQKIPISDLQRLLPGFRSLELEQQTLSFNDFGAMLFSVYGHDLLFDESARRFLLYHTELEDLLAIASESGIPTTNLKQYDIALKLAALRWSASSPHPWRIAKKLGISREYLPFHGLKLDPIEIIEPRDSIPDLFNYQSEIVQKLGRYFASNESAALVQLPTGAGKTRAAISALLQLSQTEAPMGGVLWMAHTEELCEQALETYRRLWVEYGVSEVRMGRFWGGYRTRLEDLYGEIIFAGFQKLLSIKKRDEDTLSDFSRSLRVVVIDEAHKALGTETAKLVKFFQRIPGLQLLGLTATPGRTVSDVSANKRLAKMFGNNLITAEALGNSPIEKLQKDGVLAAINRRERKTGVSIAMSSREISSAGERNDLPGSILTRLANDKERNDIIMDEIFQELDDGHQILVFSCSVNHAKLLALRTAAAGFPAGFIAYDTRRSTRRKLVEEFRAGNLRVMYNYGVLSTGFDAPNIDVVVIARPTSSIVLYSQMLGRGMRGTRVGGSGNVTVVDITDNYSNFGDVDEVYRYFGAFWK